MDEKTFLKVQLMHLNNLLKICKEHPLMYQGLIERIDAINERLKYAK